MVKVFDKDKARAEYNYKKNFLEAVLVSSITEENSWIPTIKEYVLSEVVNGTIDYIGGHGGKMNYQDRDHISIYELDMYKYLSKELKTRTFVKLHPKIKKVLNNLCTSNLVSPEGPDRPYQTVELYDFFRDVCPVSGHSIFSPPYDTVIRVQNKIFPALSLEEIEDIEGIGKAMRPHIDKDVEYIKKNYSW